MTSHLYSSQSQEQNEKRPTTNSTKRGQIRYDSFVTILNLPFYLLMNPYFFCWAVMLTTQALRSEAVSFFSIVLIHFIFYKLKGRGLLSSIHLRDNSPNAIIRKLPFLPMLIFIFSYFHFWGFLVLLFLICFFLDFVIQISMDYQHITNNQ